MRVIRSTSSVAVAGCAAAALLLAGLPFQAQSAANAPPSANAGAEAKLSRSDQDLLRNIAHANSSEVASGKIALEKAHSDEVKKFAQTMVDDHGSALKEVEALAAARSVKLPTDPDFRQKATTKKLQSVVGNRFDREYVSTAGLDDHRKTRALLQKVQRGAKDPQLKALAEKMLPVVDQHLSHAEQLARTTVREETRQ